MRNKNHENHMKALTAAANKSAITTREILAATVTTYRPGDPRMEEMNRLYLKVTA